MTFRKHQQSGFALLLSIIVTSIVLAIGLSILDLTIKELELSTLSKGSEEAFHAANAGIECARYWRNTLDEDGEEGLNDFEEGDDVSIEVECFDGGTSNVSISDMPVSDANGLAEAWRYEFEQNWGAGTNRCSVVDMIVIVAGPGVSASGVTQDDTATIANGNLPAKYPTNEDAVCPSGGRCTIAFVEGYNSTCANKDIFGTIQREVLLRF